MITVRELTSPNRPWIHLLYLGMFFFGWFYAPPEPVEAAVSLAAMVGFIAVYIFAMRRLDWTIYPAALVAVVLGLILMPQTPGGGVYLVFAGAMLGRLRFTPLVWMALVVVSATGATAMMMFAPTPLMALGFLGLVAMAAGGSAIAARNERQAAQASQTQARAAHAAAEAERQRIARDLHDLLGHTLSVVTLKAEIAEKLIDQDQGRAKAELQAIQTISRDALAEVREAVIGLRGRSLADALADAVQRLRDAGVTARVSGADQTGGLPADASTALAMVVREAVTNILRHAEAGSVLLTFRRDGAHACLDIIDDGVGGANPAGGGLSGLDARLRSLHGALRVGPGPSGSGSCVEASLPWAGGGHD